MNAPAQAPPRAPSRPIERLLRPKSVAVFGGTFAAKVVEQCRKMGYAGEIWPVHPSRGEIGGMPTYRSVDTLPGAPDAAFVGVNRHATPDIVRALGRMGAGGAICFAAGFRESADGKELEAELVEAAGDMPIVGPNCYGLINYCDGALLWPDQHGGRRLAEGERGAAIVLQSSNIAINITMQQRGLPIAYVVTAGNQAQTGLAELALGLIEDERVSVLGLHIEGFGSVSNFELLAGRARELKKPIVAYKVGRSEQARAAAVSHTASLAGSDAVSSAFLRRIGIGEVGTIPAFLETMKLLHVHGPLGGRRLSSMSCSGGEAAMMADAAAGRRVGFPPLQADHQALIREALGPIPTIANPLDYHTFVWNDGPAMRKVFSAMVSPDAFDLNILVLDYPRRDRCEDGDWVHAADCFASVIRQRKASGAVLATMPENMNEDRARSLIDLGIAPLLGVAEAMDAMEVAAAIHESWIRPIPVPVAENTGGRTGSTRTLGEAEAKSLLAGAGLAVPAGRAVGDIAEAIGAAHAIGYPVAVKVIGVAHKSEHGAVRLGIENDEELREVVGLLSTADGRELYVERMIERPAAEIIVGIVRDALFGPVLTVGTGGVLVELLADSVTLLLPATEAEIEAALRSLKLFTLMDGYRGRAKADVDAAVAAIAKVAGFAAHQADRLIELDINPLIVGQAGEGAWVADALMVLEERE